MAQVENMDALKLIPMYNSNDTLIYLDPPYLKSTRVNAHYANEFDTEEQHIKLLELALQHKGSLIISAYPNTLYDEMLTGWEKMSQRVNANVGTSRLEVIYLNNKCSKQINLFKE